jgi:hypothetical protein
MRARKNQIPMCSLGSLTCLQVQVLPPQWMVGPSSHSRPWLGETPIGTSSAVNSIQRREGEANGPQRQRPATVSRGGPSWTEFVRLADQAVLAMAGAGMINRGEPRACGHSLDPRRLDTEPETGRTAGTARNEAVDGFGKVQSDEAGFQPYWGKPTVRNEPRGWRNRGHDLMAICHKARKGRPSGSHWSKPVAPPLHSTSSHQ